MKTKRLIADVIVGRDLSDCLVLASHPDERMEEDDDTNPSLDRRTIVMKFDGRRFSDATSLPFPLDRGWSSTNGCGYCAPIHGHDVHVYSNGEWHRERFSRKDEDVLRMWGLSGEDSKHDLVYISTDGALYIRRDGTWKRQAPAKPAGSIYGVHGKSPDELYVCTDAGILLWDGSRFRELKNRPRQLMKAILVSNDEIYAGDDYLIHWTKASGWQVWNPMVPDPTALIEVQNTVVVGTFEKGVLERHERGFVSVTPLFMCLGLQQIGDGAFAVGDDRGFIRIGRRWQELSMPSCAVGALPKESR